MGVSIGFWIKIAQDAVSIFLNLRKTFMTKCLSSLPFAEFVQRPDFWWVWFCMHAYWDVFGV